MSEKTLSVFVDESGIWNESESSSRYYIVALVLHDQSFDVSEAISSFDRDIASLGIVNLCFRAATGCGIIRGSDESERDYLQTFQEERLCQAKCRICRCRTVPCPWRNSSVRVRKRQDHI